MRTPRAAALAVAAALWAAALVSAPLTAGHGAPALFAYRAAALLCHQIPDRSFAIGGVQMPVCGRCFGLYLAGAAGAAWVFARRGRGASGTSARRALAVTAVPLALSVGLEAAGLIDGSNVSRFLSALPLGFAGGWLIESVLLEDDRAPGRSTTARAI